MACVRFCFIVPLLYPVTMVLSVCKGVGGRGCPNSSSIARSTVIYLAFKNTAPISASADDDITCLRIVLMMIMAPLVSLLVLSVLLPM
jgi:hypothetical protein